MSLTLHDVSIPVFIRAFENLSRILDKGQAFAAEKGIPEAELLEARLYEDMGNLIFQVQRASDTAKFAAIRIGQLDPLAMADDETSFAELQARIRRTVDFLKSVPADAINSREDAEIELKLRTGPRLFSARDYALQFALPNFFFHVTTAYDLLRHKGVPVGKPDFLWGI